MVVVVEIPLRSLLMPTLIIDNVPVSLYHRIQHLATARQQTPSDTVLEVLESALGIPTAALAEAPLPEEPFLTEEISAPFDIPWPEGEPVVPIEIAVYVPEPHDIPDTE
jgi:hypothetical protein